MNSSNNPCHKATTTTWFNNITMQCECPPGFVGESDLVFGAPTCDMSVVALQVIWGLVAVGHGIGLIFASYVLAQRLMIGMSKRSRQKACHDLTRSTSVYVGITSIIFHTSFMLLGILHGMDVRHVVGRDLPVTLLFACGTTSFWIWSMLQCIHFLSVHTIQTRADLVSYANAWTRLRITGTLLVLCAIGAGMIPIGMVQATDFETVYVLSCIHYACTLGCLLVALDFLQSGIRPVGVELEKILLKAVPPPSPSSINSRTSSPRTQPSDATNTNSVNESVRQTARAIHSFVREIQRNALLQIVVVIAFCIPQVNVYGGWIHAIAWVTALPPAFLGTYVIRVPATLQKARLPAAATLGGMNRGLITLVDGPGATNNQGGNTISVLTAKTLSVSKSATLIAMPPAISKVVMFLLHHHMVRHVGMVMCSFVLTVFFSFVLLRTPDPANLPGEVGYAFSVVTCGGSLAICVMCMSQTILWSHLWPTQFFASVSITILVNAILLGTALNDARASLIPGLMALQLLAFSSDALVFPHLRSFIVINALGVTLVLVILVVFNLVPNVNNVILPIGSGYSLVQTLRDTLLAQVVQFTTELLFVFRGRNHKRFLHLAEGVQSRIVPFAEDKVVRANRREGNASSVMVQSGFLFRLTSQFQPTHNYDGDADATSKVDDDNDHHPAVEIPKTRVFVNKIAIRQRDCLAIHIFGMASGQQIFYFFASSFGQMLGEICTLTALVITCIIPFFDYMPELSLVLFPLALYVLAQELALSSLTVLQLLVRRVSFTPLLIFGLVWMILTSYVLRDARAMLACFAFVMYILGLLVDAKALPRSKYLLARTWTATRTSGVMLVLSIYLIFDMFPRVGHAVLTLADSGGNAATNVEQNAGTLDIGQQVGDWGLFSLALPNVARALMDCVHQWMMVWNKNNKHGDVDYLTFVNSPVAPRYDDELPQNGFVGAAATTTVMAQKGMAIVVPGNESSGVTSSPQVNMADEDVQISNDDMMRIISLELGLLLPAPSRGDDDGVHHVVEDTLAARHPDDQRVLWDIAE